MDDIQKFIEFYKQFGINLKVKTETDGRKTIIMKVENGDDEDGVSFSEKFYGYTNCYTDLTFDNNGTLIGQGFWKEIGT